MRITLLCAVMVVVPSVLSAQQVRIGPTIGASLLEHRDTSLTHGPLVDEITVGRTVLAGVTVDLRFTPHDRLAFEIVLGPYHNDVERSCITRAGQPPCTLAPFRSVSRGVLYGMYYVRTFGSRRWAPYVAGGLGVKAYAYEEELEPENVSPTFTAAFGVERDRRHPIRVEVRAMVVQDNPLLLGKTQFELQARATFLFAVSRDRRSAGL